MTTRFDFKRRLGDRTISEITGRLFDIGNNLRMVSVFDDEVDFRSNMYSAEEMSAHVAEICKKRRVYIDDHEALGITQELKERTYAVIGAKQLTFLFRRPDRRNTLRTRIEDIAGVPHIGIDLPAESSAPFDNLRLLQRMAFRISEFYADKELDRDGPDAWTMIHNGNNFYMRHGGDPSYVHLNQQAFMIRAITLGDSGGTLGFLADEARAKHLQDMRNDIFHHAREVLKFTSSDMGAPIPVMTPVVMAQGLWKVLEETNALLPRPDDAYDRNFHFLLHGEDMGEHLRDQCREMSEEELTLHTRRMLASNGLQAMRMLMPLSFESLVPVRDHEVREKLARPLMLHS
jgi:hypothetical protein